MDRFPFCMCSMEEKIAWRIARDLFIMRRFGYCFWIFSSTRFSISWTLWLVEEDRKGIWRSKTVKISITISSLLRASISPTASSRVLLSQYAPITLKFSNGCALHWSRHSVSMMAPYVRRLQRQMTWFFLHAVFKSAKWNMAYWMGLKIGFAGQDFLKRIPCPVISGGSSTSYNLNRWDQGVQQTLRYYQKYHPDSDPDTQHKILEDSLRLHHLFRSNKIHLVFLCFLFNLGLERSYLPGM